VVVESSSFAPTKTALEKCLSGLITRNQTPKKDLR